MPTDTFFNLPDEKRQLFLDVAIAEFADHPYQVASISNIVRKVKIAKGSFYQYFKNKKELYKYLIILGTEEKLKLVNTLPTPDNHLDFFGYMRRQFLAAVYFEIRHPSLARIAYRAFVEEIPFPEMAEELRRRGATQFYKQLITQGIINGDVTAWIDPDMAAFIMQMTFHQFGKYLIKRLGLTEADLSENSIVNNVEIDHVLTSLMDIFEAGMKRNPAQWQNYLGTEP